MRCEAIVGGQRRSRDGGGQAGKDARQEGVVVEGKEADGGMD